MNVFEFNVFLDGDEEFSLRSLTLLIVSNSYVMFALGKVS